MPNYGDPKYWEDRYNEQNCTTFDWLEDYETLKPIIDDLKMDKESKILNVGCGNSEFCENMYDDGYLNIYNIDICENVIKFMKERNQNRKSLIFETMDVRDLTYNDNFFDLIVDKSTIDALLCGDNSFINVAIMTKEIIRTLKVGGIYMIISYGQPENRIFHLEREHLAFDITIYTIKKDISEDTIQDKEKAHYVYICKKKPNADQVLAENFQKVYYELEKLEMMEEDDNYNEDEEYNLENQYQNENENHN